jgi:tetratricopeptide (TPR) repeat protein
MIGVPRPVRLIPLCLAVVLAWGVHAEAHRRGGLPLVRPAPPPLTQAPASAPLADNLTGPLALQPEAYWQRLLAEERAGELHEARKTGLALVNLFPRAPQRASALLKLAELVTREGNTAEALELYGLAAVLAAGSPEGVQACLEATALQFSRDLPQGDPVRTLGRFLKTMSVRPAGYSSEALTQALKTGWQAVALKVRATSPLPLSLVEEILALWELQPKGLGPPEAAQLVTDLLREKGLGETARTLAAQAGKNQAEPHRMIDIPPSEIPWLTGKWPGLTHILAQVDPGEEVRQSLLGAWLAGGRAGVESESAAGDGLLAWFPPGGALAAGWAGPPPARGPNLLHLRPNPPLERLRTELARSSLSERPFFKTSRLKHSPAEAPVTEDLGPFYQDRLGLSHLKDGQPEAAQTTFQELSRHRDPFWQRLARVRLADLELSRLQAKPSP